MKRKFVAVTSLAVLLFIFLFAGCATPPVWLRAFGYHSDWPWVPMPIGTSSLHGSGAYSEKLNAITLPTFLSNRFDAAAGMLRIVSTVVILFSLFV